MIHPQRVYIGLNKFYSFDYSLILIKTICFGFFYYSRGIIKESRIDDRFLGHSTHSDSTSKASSILIASML